MNFSVENDNTSYTITCANGTKVKIEDANYYGPRSLEPIEMIEFVRNNDKWLFCPVKNGWIFVNTANGDKHIATQLRSWRTNDFKFSPSGMLFALNSGMYASSERETCIVDITDFKNAKFIYAVVDYDDYCCFPIDEYYWEQNDKNEDIFVQKFRYNFTKRDNKLVMVNEADDSSDEDIQTIGQVFSEYRLIKHQRIPEKGVKAKDFLHFQKRKEYIKEMIIVSDQKGPILKEWELQDACYQLEFDFKYLNLVFKVVRTEWMDIKKI